MSETIEELHKCYTRMKKLSKQISPKVLSRSETIEEHHQHGIKNEKLIE
ncbi:hypothetical protein [Flavobacterium ardleyense]|nr:hypothetical protein [Flavobacterium ardleyense]